MPTLGWRMSCLPPVDHGTNMIFETIHKKTTNITKYQNQIFLYSIVFKLNDQLISSSDDLYEKVKFIELVKYLLYGTPCCWYQRIDFKDRKRFMSAITLPSIVYGFEDYEKSFPYNIFQCRWEKHGIHRTTTFCRNEHPTQKYFRIFGFQNCSNPNKTRRLDTNQRFVRKFLRCKWKIFVYLWQRWSYIRIRISVLFEEQWFHSIDASTNFNKISGGQKIVYLLKDELISKIQNIAIIF